MAFVAPGEISDLEPKCGVDLGELLQPGSLAVQSRVRAHACATGAGGLTGLGMLTSFVSSSVHRPLLSPGLGPLGDSVAGR